MPRLSRVFPWRSPDQEPTQQVTFHSPWNSMRRRSWLPSSLGTGIPLQAHCVVHLEGLSLMAATPEAFPAPCKVSWRLFLLHRWQTLSPQPWSSLPAAPADGVKVLKVPFSILLLDWSSQQWHWDVLGAPELSLPQLSGVRCA